MPSYKLKLWIDFCKRFRIRESGVPLFRAENGVVSISRMGRGAGRRFLQRSTPMDKLVVSEVRKIIHDYTDGQHRYEGLVYLMYQIRGQLVIPLYVGKSEKYGKRGGNLSAKIKRIERNPHKFCHWGYGYDCHIGDLSAVVCAGHPEEKRTPKYKRWADKLFKIYPTIDPKLKAPVHFWIKAWKIGETGIWPEFGPTSLTFLEYLLIGVASDLFPQRLLNEEGINRS
jgi:hypothetical protein